MRAAREAKRAAMGSAQAARQSAKTAKTTARGLKAMAEAAAHAVKAVFAALIAGRGRSVCHFDLDCGDHRWCSHFWEIPRAVRL